MIERIDSKADHLTRDASRLGQIDVDLDSTSYFRDPVTFVVPVERPALSRNVVCDPELVAVPDMRPDPSRNVVVPPLVVDVPT